MRPSPAVIATVSCPPVPASRIIGRLVCVPSQPPYAPTLHVVPLKVALSPVKVSPHLNSTRLPLPRCEPSAVLKLEVCTMAAPAGHPSDPGVGVPEADTH